jgi:hypothetical protein
MELYLHFPNMPSWRGAQLKKSTGTTLPLPLIGLILSIFHSIQQSMQVCPQLSEAKFKICETGKVMLPFKNERKLNFSSLYNDRTPHTQKLHIVRKRLMNGAVAANNSVKNNSGQNS